MFCTTTTPSPIGLLTMISDGESLVGLGLANQKYFPFLDAEEIVQKPRLPLFRETKRWLTLYFAGKPPAISDLPLAPQGSEFRKAVWKILCDIPYGELVTYGKIATQMAVKLGKTRMAAQAVGGAVGHNPISIIIPCHRVVGAGGNLTGYGGGMDKKIQLLKGEGVDMSQLFVPNS